MNLLAGGGGTLPWEYAAMMSAAHSIQLKGVSETFHVTGKAPYTAVRDILFHVGVGSFLSIVGPSGCGKSTILNAIAGLLLPAEGTIEILSDSPLSPWSSENTWAHLYDRPRRRLLIVGALVGRLERYLLRWKLERNAAPGKQLA
jgi:ABC-type glutathione transport system ATPase component